MMQEIPQNLFFTKNDPDDPRLGEKAKHTHLQNLQEPKLAIWGYSDDRGISMNGGRAGAASAPNQIREFFYKMTPPVDKIIQNLQIAELGNLQTSDDLTQDHAKARSLSQTCTEKNIPWCSLGGGHDWGYADGAGFLKASQGMSPLIINFDAHFDVRPLGQKGPHSGTPFFRLLEEFSDFEFLEVGIQPQCNSQKHLDYLRQKGGKVILIDAVHENGLINALTTVISSNPMRPVFLSIDIDAFAASEAPGASQSWPIGISVHDFMKALRFLNSRFLVKGIGIYEVSPPLDVVNLTSKLAANIMHEFLRCKM